MAPKLESALVNGVERILEDGTSNLIFSATDISAQLQDSLKELSEYSPWEIVQTKLMEASTRLGEQLTGNKGREVDISDIENLIDLKVEYPVGNNPPTFRNFQRYGGKIYLDIDSRPTPGAQNDSAGDLQELTGTVTFTAASTAVTGSGTAFTSELEPGYYIATESGTNWYRVSSVTDDTNLIISINCATADTGADTADSTRYWYEYVNLWCKKNHYVEATMTDFLGAIDSGAATGYAEGTYRITIDALTAGTYPKNMLFTIAGTLGVYRNTADVTVASTEGDFIIEPRLKERAAEDAAITFIGSTLNQNEERLLMELVAARSALNWVGDARTALDNAVTAYGLANAEVDKITARITILTTASTGHLALMKTALTANFSSVTTQIGDAEDELDSAATACQAIDDAIGDYTTTADMAAQDLADALAQLDFAVTAVAVLKDAIATEDSDIDTAITAVATQLGNAVTDLTTDVDAVNNTITTGSNVVPNLINKAMGEMSAARAYIANAEALKNPNSHYGVEAEHELRLAIGQIRRAQGLISLEGAVTSENAMSVRAYVATAQGYIRESLAYLQADAQQTASYARLIGSELQTVNGLLSQASGYFQEANTSVRTSYAITAVNRWAQIKLRDTLLELRRMRKPKQKSYSYSRG